MGPGVLKCTINHRDGFAPAAAGWPQGKWVGGRKEEAAGELRFSKHMWAPGPFQIPNPGEKEMARITQSIQNGLLWTCSLREVQETLWFGSVTLTPI